MKQYIMRITKSSFIRNINMKEGTHTVFIKNEKFFLKESFKKYICMKMQDRTRQAKCKA